MFQALGPRKHSKLTHKYSLTQVIQHVIIFDLACLVYFNCALMCTVGYINKNNRSYYYYYYYHHHYQAIIGRTPQIKNAVYIFIYSLVSTDPEIVGGGRCTFQLSENPNYRQDQAHPPCALIKTHSFYKTIGKKKREISLLSDKHAVILSAV